MGKKRLTPKWIPLPQLSWSPDDVFVTPDGRRTDRAAILRRNALRDGADLNPETIPAAPVPARRSRRRRRRWGASP
jgi:hypothetical protein